MCVLLNYQKSTLELNRIGLEPKPDTLSLSGVNRIISITEPAVDSAITPRTPSATTVPASASSQDLQAMSGDDSAKAAAATPRNLQTPVITEENEFGDPPHKSSLSLHVEPSGNPASSAAAGVAATTVATNPDGTPSAAATRRKLSVQVWLSDFLILEEMLYMSRLF